MAIYAFRESTHSRILVEFDSAKQLASCVKANEARDSGIQPYTFRRIDASTAHQWVKRGNVHETCLWIDFDGRIRHA